MTSDTSDPIDILIRLKEGLEARIQEEEARREVLRAAVNEVNRDLLIADCISFLRQIPTQNLSQDKRTRLSALRNRLNEALKTRAA